jgi:hypothetical protein
MQTRLLSGCVAAVAAVAFLAAAPVARAGTVTMLLDHTTGQSTNATFNGSGITAAPGPYYWKNPPTALNANTATFCVQLDQFVTVGNTYQFQTSSLANLPTVGNSIKANYITELFGRHFNTAWLNPSFTGSTASVAFQLALWELIYDGPTTANPKGNLNLANGTFADTSSGDAAAVSLAGKYLNGGSGGYVALTGDASQFALRLPGYSLTGLTDVTGGTNTVSGGIQDQIVITPPQSVVPAPAGVWLAGAGLLALIGRGRLRRKATETAA